MKTQTIGKTSLTSTRLAYGCWRLVSTWEPSEVTPQREDEGRTAVIAAYEAGYTLFDNADIYCRGVCEKVFGDAMRGVSGMRDRILVATKCGIRFEGDPKPDSPGRYDFSTEYILWSCDLSLKRMGVETIDLYQLHRPDVLMNPEDVAAAFYKLKSQGKVREFGVSNFSPSQHSALQKACPMPLVVNQVEINLGRIDCFNDGTLDQCLGGAITPLAWSPLGGGMMATGGTIPPSHPRRQALTKVLEVLDAIALQRNTTRTNVALAWLLKHPARIIPIVGSHRPQNIVDATKADDLELTREEWYRLFVAARGQRMP